MWCESILGCPVGPLLGGATMSSWWVPRVCTIGKTFLERLGKLRCPFFSPGKFGVKKGHLGGGGRHFGGEEWLCQKKKNGSRNMMGAKRQIPSLLYNLKLFPGSILFVTEQ